VWSWSWSCSSAVVVAVTLGSAGPSQCLKPCQIHDPNFDIEKRHLPVVAMGLATDRLGGRRLRRHLGVVVLLLSGGGGLRNKGSLAVPSESLVRGFETKINSTYQWSP
jgi:hypothetical protein